MKPGAGSVKCVLAPSFGMLGKETYKEMDAALSLMLVSTIRELQIARSKGPGSDLTWEAVNAVLKQNTYLEHDPGISVHRVQDFTRDSVSIFKTRGKNKSNRNFAIAKEVRQSKLLDILADNFSKG